MEFKTELEVRQEIFNRLQKVYEVIDELVSITVERNYKSPDGKGYRLGINKNDYNEVKTNFSDFYDMRHLISQTYTTNYDDWQTLFQMVYSFIYLFKEGKIFFMNIYETNTVDMMNLKNEVRNFVLAKKIDPVKNSAEYVSYKGNLSLKESFELVCKENNIQFDEELDFNGKKDFILYSFTSAKYEVAINGVNEEFAEFIKNNPSAIPHLDDMSWMLEIMHDNNVIDEDQFEEYEAYYEDIIPLIEDVEELVIYTKSGDPISIEESQLSITPFRENFIGDLIDEKLEGMDYYYLVMTGAPAYHSGIILIDEETNKEKIIKKLKLIQIEEYSLGFKYEENEDYFDIGDQIKQKYVTANLIPAEEIASKDINQLFKN